ncbi:MAG: glycosyltransferase family 39 protein [Candidatus Nanoarchaeia archaeon]|nr:glycosyltransferase family 39 protein [Candidatus Nanoarchaeia archaeon]
MDNLFSKENLTKNKYLIILILILLLGFFIRIQYFHINQGVWWDEAEYLNMAKKWAYNLPADISDKRPILISFIFFLMYKINLGETSFRILMLLFSLGGILLSYLLVKEMFNNKKLALITSFMASVFYLSVFYCQRLLVEFPSLTLTLWVFYLFWKGYMKDKPKLLYLMGIVLALSVMLRFTGGLAGIIIVLFVLIKDKFKALKNKHLWIALLLFFLTITPYLIYSYMTYGNPIQSFITSGGSATVAVEGGSKFTFSMGLSQLWIYLGFLKEYTKFFWFIFVIIGLYKLLDFILGFDLMIKGKNETQYPNLFVILMFIIPLIYFSFFVNHFEDRYGLYLVPVLFIFSGYGILVLYDLIKKHNKTIAIIALLIVLAIGGYQQYKDADSLIKSRASSFGALNPAGKWLNAHTTPEDNILSVNTQMELQYYAGRYVRGLGINETVAVDYIQKNKPKYLVVSAYFPSPEWQFKFAEYYQQYLKPVMAFDADSKMITTQEQQPVLIIYEFIYS